MVPALFCKAKAVSGVPQPCLSLVPLAGLEEDEDQALVSQHCCFLFCPSSQAPAWGKLIGKVCGGALNEVAPVLPSFLRNSRERYRG